MVLEFSVGALDLFLLAYSAFLPQPFIYFIRCICCYTICVFLFDCFQSQKLLFELGVPGAPRGRRLPDKSTLSAFSTIVSLRNQRLNYYKLTSWSGPHYRKPRVRRVPKISPCAIPRAHGENHICRAQHQNHTAKQEHTAKYDFAVCRVQDTRRPQNSPCAHSTAHGEAGSTWAAANGRWLPYDNVKIRRVPIQHTANICLCRVPQGSTRRRYSHVCPILTGVERRCLCRALTLGTRQTHGFAVCQTQTHGKHKSLLCADP